MSKVGKRYRSCDFRTREGQRYRVALRLTLLRQSIIDRAKRDVDELDELIARLGPRKPKPA